MSQKQQINLILYINDSKLYLEEKIKETYTNWGFNHSDMIKLTTWTKGALKPISLFTKPFGVLDLTDKKDLSNFKKLTEEKKLNIFDDGWFGNGLIIISTDAKGKWLPKFVEKWNGTVEYKLPIKDAKSKLLKELQLPPHLRDIVSYYIGDEYEKILLVKKSLENISFEEKQELSEEELYTYLPSKMGETPPWELISNIFKGNTQAAITEYKRTIKTSHPIILLALIKSKLSNFIKYNQLKDIYKEQEILKLLKFKNSYALIDFKYNKNISNETLENLLDLLLKYENDVKGGSYGIPLNEHIEDLIVRFCIAIKQNTKVYWEEN